VKKSISEVGTLWWNNNDTGQQEGCRVLIAGRNLVFLTKAMFYLFLRVRER
jgi:hypothetical protein